MSIFAPRVLCINLEKIGGFQKAYNKMDGGQFLGNFSSTKEYRLIRPDASILSGKLFLDTE